jgi:hypothetical protein
MHRGTETRASPRWEEGHTELTSGIFFAQHPPASNGDSVASPVAEVRVCIAGLAQTGAEAQNHEARPLCQPKVG